MALTMSYSLKNHGVRVLVRKIRRRLKRPGPLQPECKRVYARLPEGGENTSVETALNSRCSSDYDDKPEISHWGMFDRSARLSEQDVRRIIEYSDIRRLTDRKLEIRAQDSQLFFLADAEATGPARDRLMVESGMQQQAVSLVCAALGVGSLILNLGLNGKLISERDFATVRIQLGPMKPSYDGSYWSSAAPEKERKWHEGNLPVPARTGKVTLLSAMKAYDLSNPEGIQVDEPSLGQILWAARGRTPHFYNCTPWGLTIPTWTGKQDISGLHLLSKDGLFEYVNWKDKRPTHSLERIRHADNTRYRAMLQAFPPWDGFVILSAGEAHARALWEIGYQLLNLLLQAHALRLAYQLILLNADHKALFATSLEAGAPVAVIGIHLKVCACLEHSRPAPSGC